MENFPIGYYPERGRISCVIMSTGFSRFFALAKIQKVRFLGGTADTMLNNQGALACWGNAKG
jgi:hypothetical protein